MSVWAIYDASKGGIEAFHAPRVRWKLAGDGVDCERHRARCGKDPRFRSLFRGNLARERGDPNTDMVDAEFATRIPLGTWASPDDIGQATVSARNPGGALHYRADDLRRWRTQTHSLGRR